MTLHSFSDENDFWKATLKSSLKIIEEALKKHGQVRIGLAGGSTPKKLYEDLAQENLPWQKITWIVVDERYVPDEDPESNRHMLRQALFEPAHIPHENQVTFDITLSPEEATIGMSQKLKRLEEARMPLFDLLILGAGKDGHIASLFEGDPHLHTKELAYTVHAPAEYKTTQRLTLSLRILSHSTRGLLLLKGKEKRSVLKTLEGEPILPLTALKSLTAKVPTEVFFCP
ncbi:6-phosphogluconolactonase [Candidatus Peregrinibacteria bacterium]|nr:MAG: 6-phosphogluconolactonase [Candidatus Peregrinibacteria bacterium]